MSDLKRQPAVRRHEMVQEQIEALILSGQLNPGDALLPERELAQTLGVSRPSVRQALVSLESKGLVKITPRGAFVAESHLGKPLLSVVAAMVNQQDAILEFIEYRKVLEVGGVRLAALRATPKDISLIAGCIEQMEAHLRQGLDPFEPDLQMHLAIARATHNLFINEMMKLVGSWLQMETYTAIRKAVYALPGESERWVERSRSILEAIRNGDSELAAAEMTTYLDRVEETVRAYLRG